jgi:diguanylate cyclase (GGDEF)-like protein
MHEEEQDFRDTLPSARRRLIVAAACVVATIAVAVLDWLTGSHVSLLPFYAAPVALAAWLSGAWPGLCAAAAASLGLLVVASLEQAPPHPGYAYWNALAAGSVFAALGLSLSRQREARLRERANARSDPLTGVRTQRDFYEAVELEIRRAERAPRPMTLAYIDVDDFRRFNDQMGRPAGDEVLRRTAEVLRKNTRVTDLVGRVGGDDFAVLLPETDPDGAMAVLWKLRRRLQRAMDRRRWTVTFSIGAVTFTRAPRDAEDIVRRADRLVVAVKLEGKNQVRHETVSGAPRASA